MAQVDKIKEEIGWLKVVFGLFVAVDFSLIGWRAQHFSSAPTFSFWLVIIVVLVISSFVIGINRKAYSKIRSLGVIS